MTKRLIAILLMTAMLVALFSIGDTARADNPTPQFQANIGGRTINVSKESIIGQGTIVSGTVAPGSGWKVCT